MHSEQEPSEEEHFVHALLAALVESQQLLSLQEPEMH